MPSLILFLFCSVIRNIGFPIAKKIIPSRYWLFWWKGYYGQKRRFSLQKQRSFSWIPCDEQLTTANRKQETETNSTSWTKFWQWTKCCANKVKIQEIDRKSKIWLERRNQKFGQKIFRFSLVLVPKYILMKKSLSPK